MAADSNVQKVGSTLMSIQGKVQDRRTAWIQLLQTFRSVQDTINAVSGDARSYRGQVAVRNVIFEERNKFIDVMSVCMNLREIKRKFQDVFKALRTLLEFEGQTIEDIIQELKLSEYRQFFQTNGLNYAMELLDIDQRATFEPCMKPAPFRRLQKKIETINTVKGYLDTSLDTELSTAVNNTQQYLRNIVLSLKSSFAKIDALQSPAVAVGGNGDNSGGNVLSETDVLGLTAIGVSIGVAYYYYSKPLSPLLIILVVIIFRNSVFSAFRCIASRQGKANNQNPHAGQREGLQTKLSDEWSIRGRQWANAMNAELDEWAQLMKQFHGYQSNVYGNKHQISGQITAAQDQLKNFLEDADALETELKRLSSSQ
ncbi:uncharacterized protein [Ptychodera flava]|uniref:uncharacterized protein n=1 Tax=Ptychodera flava TaxID=63121 RepID=UPI00396A7B1D